MPQLELGPWFAYFVFSWLVLLGGTMYKVLAHNFLSDPGVLSGPGKSRSWSWLWY